MEHYKFFLIPLLMLSDYFLTVIGAKLAEKSYRKHFKFPDYELNPVFRKAIAQKRWFNPFHLTLVSVVTFFCFCWSYSSFVPLPGFDQVSDGLFGYLVTLFASLNAIHLSNILLFKHLQKHPQDLSGQVTMSQNYLMVASRCRALTLLVPLTLALCFAPSAFLFGAVASQIALVMIKFVWARKKKIKPESAKTVPSQVAVCNPASPNSSKSEGGS